MPLTQESTQDYVKFNFTAASRSSSNEKSQITVEAYMCM